MLESSVLIYSDEPSTGRIWGILAADLHCRPIAVSSLQAAIDAVEECYPEVIVIDAGFRQTNALAICTALREHSGNAVLVLTPINNESHTLEVYQAGADDCIVKPISPALFAAKLRVWLSRAQLTRPEALSKIVIGGLVLDPLQHELVGAKDTKISLTNHELRVLHLLLSHRNQALSNEEIIEKVWGSNSAAGPSLVKNVIYRLRKKIEPEVGAGRGIVSVPGGYLFKR
jgi:DNA-binding response OmpR family regulator